MMGAFYEGMKSVLAGTLSGRGTHGDSATYVGSRQGALTGSIFSKVPTLTVEMCVLTNAQDETFINSASGQAKMVEALRAGLEYALGGR
jgi:N-acetylmuramoyl-L-alanine amidase